MTRFMATVTLALTLAVPASAQESTTSSVTEPVSMIDTSSVEADGDRIIRLSILVPSARDKVWSALTTDAGWRRMGVAFVHVDFRVGSLIETSYAPDSSMEDARNIQNEVVAYVPGRMLAIRNVKAPPGFPHAAEFAKTATVMELADDTGQTRLTLTATGFAPRPAYDALHAMFLEGNAATLRMLRDSYAEYGSLATWRAFPWDGVSPLSDGPEAR